MTDSPDDAAPVTFAQRLEHLFATRPNPATEKRWTWHAAQRAIAAHVATLDLPPDERSRRLLSDTYIKTLANGEAPNPGIAAVRSLAALFGVEPEYFLQSTPPPDRAPDIVTARIRDLSDGLSEETLAEIADVTAQMIRHARRLEGLDLPPDS